MSKATPVQKPQPIARTVVRIDGISVDESQIAICTVSPSVATWIEQEAPDFGILTPNGVPGQYRVYILRVQKQMYDPKAIAQYIEAQAAIWDEPTEAKT